MINKTRFFAFIKVGLSLALFVLGTSGVEAQNEQETEIKPVVTIKAQNDIVCGGHPIVIEVTRDDPHTYIKLFKKSGGEKYDKNTSHDGYELCNPNNTGTLDQLYFVDMDESATYMWIWAWQCTKDGWVDVPAAEPIQITRQQTGCPAPCHTSSTGDDLSGTDFTPNSEGTSCIPNGVEQFFEDYYVMFKGKDRKCGTDYNIVSDRKNLSDFLDGHTPKKDDSLYADNTKYSNSYMTLTSPNGQYYELEYNGNRTDNKGNEYSGSPYFWASNAGKYYRYTTRAYFVCPYMSDQCKFPVGEGFIARTTHGNGSTDRLELYLYDDLSGKLIGKESIISNGTPDIRLENISIDGGWESYQNKLIRAELYFYGQFPDNNTYNKFSFTPEFAQWNGCVNKIAIDYISSEIQNVCYDRSVICLGDGKEVKAVGFPKDADYNWSNDNQNWFSTGKKNTYFIKPTSAGVHTWYVKDFNHPEMPAISFKIVVEECTPPKPDFVKGPDKICVPTDNPVQFAALYEDSENFCKDEKACYHWNIRSDRLDDKTVVAYFTEQRNPNTQELERIQYGPAKFVNADPSSNSYGKVNIIFDDDFPEGTYWLRSHLYWNGAPVTGEYVDMQIHVYQKPKPTYELALPLCPFSDNKMTVTPLDAAKYDYDFQWNTKHVDGDPVNVGHVTINTDPLKCTYDQLIVAARVKVKELTNCYTDIVINAPVNNQFPTLDCDDLQAKFVEVFKQYSVVKDGKDIVLEATKADVQITLPLPKVETTCDDDPVITIVGAGSDVYGDKFSYNLSKKLSEITSSDLKVTIPVTAGKAPDNNGIMFTYSVTDGCNRTSIKSCQQKVIVRDVDAPDVNCQTVFSVKDLGPFRTSQQEGCAVVPGYPAGSPIMPVLVAPTATENGKPLVVTYMGRLENPAVAPKETDDDLLTKFVGSVTLNAEYNPGVTYILWEFADGAKNKSYCIQSVTVINDKAPVVNCKNEDLGKVSVNELCKLSFQEIFPKIPTNQLPTAENMCTNEVLTVEDARLFYKEASASVWTEITKEKYTEALFHRDSKYDFEWRFYVTKNGDTNPGPGVDPDAYNSCPFKIEVVDSILPTVNCEVLKDIAVPFNSNSNYGENSADEDVKITFEYASGLLPDGEMCYCNDEKYFDEKNNKYYGDFTKYTLKDFFATDNFVFPVGLDNCDNPTLLKMEVALDENANASYITAANEINTLIAPLANSKDPNAYEEIRELLRKFKFPEGTHHITYEYSDNSNNSTTCSQTIIVYSGLFVNCAADVTLPADKDCKAAYDLKPEDIAKATVSFVREFRRKDYKNKCAAVEPVSEEDFAILSLSSDSMVPELANKHYDVYPIRDRKSVV